MFSAELPFDGDVQLVTGRIVVVLGLAVPAGSFVATATVALVNRSPVARRVDLWLTALPPPEAVNGPRSAHVDLQPGAVASVTVGPAAATLHPSTLEVVAQVDGEPPGLGSGLWAVEGTEQMNRAGATGLLALGAAS